MVDAAHEKENRAKDTIQQLKREIANLSQLVEQGAGLTVGQENTVNELIKVKDELTKERDTLNSQIVGLRHEIREHLESIQKLEQSVQQKTLLTNQVQEKYNGIKRDYDVEIRKRERNEKELRELNQVLGARQADVRARAQQVNELKDRTASLEAEIRDKNQSAEKAAKDYEALQQRLSQNQFSLEEEIQANSTLLQQATQHKSDLNLKEIEIAQLKANETKLIKVKETQQKSIKKLGGEKDELAKKIEELKMVQLGLERNIDTINRDKEQLNKQLQELQRDRDLRTKQFLKEAKEKQKQIDEVKVMERKGRNLEQEVSGHRAEAQRQRKSLYQLEKDREQYAGQASQATSKYYQALEEVKIRQMTVLDCQKQLAEAETKLKQQQSLYEAVRSERNMYSKNLIEAHDEISEMKRKFKIMSHQVDQLKEEISSKEKALVEEHIAQKKQEKVSETLKSEIQLLRTDNANQAKKIAALDQEISTLHSIIADVDQERAKQRKKLKSVLNERDILGTQLVRRNDELALLYEKIKIQQSTLNKGEVQYRDRLVDIRMLRLKIQDLKRGLHLSQGQLKTHDELKQRLHKLDRALLSERNKVKALSQELENPLNIHRWRRLEGSDPKELEMVQKVQTLQKRLIAKTEECVEKDMLLKEKDRLYTELKNVLARQPGPEVAEQLNVYHETLRKRNTEMKRLASELNMHATTESELKFEYERRSRELQEYKKKFYEERMKNHLLQRDRQLAKSTPADPSKAPVDNAGQFALTHPAGQVRYAGGGFSLGSNTMPNM
eukprot:NODE_114_length_2750_cov_114.198815_g90_i0.p1 GENE.NODE_114_length_2750_cov_114.198815_g90_i0~~NODE_114_length_2750_cov_114.198815_g90_i0.p1  ORF type:complete len:895 (-),score=391.13 NODE_114_length_2750_cov_114.198815_g90_i0:64-2415(-)